MKGYFHLFHGDLKGRVSHASFEETLSFNDSAYGKPVRPALHGLNQFRDFILHAEGSMDLCYESGTLVIPLEGTFSVTTGATQQEIYPGMRMTLKDNTAFSLTNTDTAAQGRIILLNFPGISENLSDMFALERNRWTDIYLETGRYVRLGLFGARCALEVAAPTSAVFVTVLHGVFEIEDRLLEPQDALLCTGQELLDGESLSENGLLLSISV